MSYIVILCIGILACITIIMMFTHSIALERFGVLEFFTLLIVSACIFLGYNETSAIVKEHYMENMSEQLNEFSSYLVDIEVDAKTAKNMQEKYSQLEMLLDMSLGEIYKGALLIQRDSDSSYTECKGLGEYRELWDEAETSLDYLIEKAVRTECVQAQELSNGNMLFLVIAKTAEAPTYIGLVEISTEAMNEELNKLLEKYVMYGAMILFFASMVYLFIVFCENKELHKVMKLATGISGDISNTKRTLEENECQVRTNEMRVLYNSLKQIANDVMRVNYDKYQILQVYYRFAPKDIEKIMGKKSILDVSVNEQISMEATLAYISFNINERLEQHEQLNTINACYTKLGEKRKKYEGIIFNSSSDLSTIQVMFQQETSKAVDFAVEMASSQQENLRDDKTFILLHRTSFIYGISGDEEQNFTFVHSAEMRCIEKYVDSLRNMGIRMAVTDYVHDRLPKDVACRYAGYIQEGDLKFQLYEILEVYPESERKCRMETSVKFEEAIKLFYQSDFYFARTAFTEILKKCPNDNLVKHYIFKCEKCLNNNMRNYNEFSLFD